MIAYLGGMTVEDAKRVGSCGCVQARAQLAAWRPVVEAAKVESAEHAASGKCFGRDGHTCPLCDAVGDLLRDALRATPTHHA